MGVYKTTLANEVIDEGQCLLQKLDRLRFRIEAAFWHYDPETKRWKLVLVSPVVDRRGPISAYRQIQKAMGSGATNLALDEIFLVSPQSFEFSGLRTEIERMAPARKTSERPRDHIWLQDAFIYRWLAR